MKRAIILVVLMFVVVGMVFAMVWGNMEQFQEYKAVKTTATEADETGNTTVAVAKYLEAANIAKEGATPVIEGWQRNSAAYVLIKLHKKSKETAILVEAMTYLTDAKAIVDGLIQMAKDNKVEPDAKVLDLKDKVESNIVYCKNWLGIQ